MQNIGGMMARGAAWMVMFKLIDRSIGLVSIVILARILLPEDFGLIFMATSIIAMLELFSAFGFDIVLIQKQDAGRAHFDTVWTYNLMFGLAVSVVLVLLAPVAVSFYGETRLSAVMYVLAIGAFASAFENVGLVKFRKELEFDKEFIFRLAKRISAFVITVPLAIYFRSYWALVAGMVGSRVFGSALSFVMHPFRPRVSLAASAEIFRFSRWLLINNLLNFLRLRSADFIIGRLSGASGLGLFSTAYEISNLPTTELVAPINRAVFPAYAKMASDIAKLREGYLSVIAMIGMFALPAAAGLAATSQLLVDLLLGEKWQAAGPIIAVLSFYGAANAMLANTASVYNALGKPYVTSIFGSVRIGILVPALVYFTSKYGVLGAAWTYLGVTLGFMPITYFVVFRVVGARVTQFISIVWRPLLAAALMYLLVLRINVWFPVGDNTADLALKLGFSVVFGAIAYCAAVGVFWLLAGRPDGAERFVISRLLPKVRSLLPGGKQ